MITKKDLIEAIDDMPMDAKIKYLIYCGDDEDIPYNYNSEPIDNAVYVEHLNEILLC